MDFSSKGLSNNKDAKMKVPNKVTSLNPHAAEFVPSAFRSSFANAKISDVPGSDVPEYSADSVLDRSESNVSNKSDDEAQRYWRDQLPDDIIPDFKSMGGDDLHAPEQLSLDTLSLRDDVRETSRFLTTGTYPLFGKQQDGSPLNGSLNFADELGYLGSTYLEDQQSNAFLSLAGNEWDKSFMNADQQFTNGSEGHHYNGDASAGLITDSFNGQAILEDTVVNHLEFLASQFPGFAAESLADLYYANSCDLSLTVEMLTQLELQDSSFSQISNSKSSEAPPNFSALDFPALPATESNNGMSKFNGQDHQRSSNSYRSSSNIFSSTVDFASTVRKLASQESANRKFERSVTADRNVGSSRSSQLLSMSYSGDKVRSSAARAAPVWLETGEAVANMYSELREDARDFARLRNACFEQARQAYLVGNGALARELSRKGQLYNMQMKAAHGKARETIYRQRNPAGVDAQGSQDRLIDLHGLHVNEAIHVLEHELRALRSAARAAGQRLQVMICVGTGHHTKGSRTPARLPVAVEQFLLDENLHFTQPQPGLLRVLIH